MTDTIQELEARIKVLESKFEHQQRLLELYDIRIKKQMTLLYNHTSDPQNPHRFQIGGEK